MYMTYEVGRLREIVALMGECFEKKGLNLKGCSEIPVGEPRQGNFNSSAASWTEFLWRNWLIPAVAAWTVETQ